MHKTTYETPYILSGPFRSPVQMLDDQIYNGGNSLHHGEVATNLGFKDGPIEGPTHFSQFVPLLVKIWGNTWYEKGCFSSHFKNIVVAGEKVKAFVEVPAEGATITRCWAEKEDGTLILEASASIGQAEETLLEKRLANRRPYQQLVILKDLKIGMKAAEEELVCMQPDQHLGELYPFTLNQKLSAITEKSVYYEDANASPWGQAIIPLEMVSVLHMYDSAKAKWPIKQPSIGMFSDLQIRMIKGPLLVGETYLIRKEIVGLDESRRTEGFWIKSRIFDKTGTEQVAEVLLHEVVFKESYPHYSKEIAL